MSQASRRFGPGHIAAAVLAVIVLGLATYSYVTSRHIDNTAAGSGSSTDPKAPNTVMDRPRAGQPEQTTGTSNVPPPAPPKQP
jgi:hypothetical protein